MTLSLENLSSVFSKQYDELCESRPEHGVKTENEYLSLVGDSRVEVTSKMERMVHKIPDGAAFCGGKLSTDTVVVTVNPPDEKIEQAVASFFKSRVFPAMFGAPAMPVFDEVKINGKKIMLA